MTRPPLEDFRRQSRDLFVPAGDMSFWQATLRDEHEPIWTTVHNAITAHRAILIDVLYSDYEGGQRTISRFHVIPRGEERTGWFVTVVRHWEPGSTRSPRLTSRSRGLGRDATAPSCQTPRRHHATTPQRHDATTPRRHDATTPRRHDAIHRRRDHPAPELPDWPLGPLRTARNRVPSRNECYAKLRDPDAHRRCPMTGSGLAGLVLHPRRLGRPRSSGAGARSTRRPAPSSAWWWNGSSSPDRRPVGAGPSRPEVCIQTVRAATSELADRASRPDQPGGRGRTLHGWPNVLDPAVAEGLDVAAMVLVSYPLHPPGRPERLRTAHFPALRPPCLFVSGPAGRLRHPRRVGAGDCSHQRGGHAGLRGRRPLAAQT